MLQAESSNPLGSVLLAAAHLKPVVSLSCSAACCIAGDLPVSCQPAEPHCVSASRTAGGLLLQNPHRVLQNSSSRWPFDLPVQNHPAEPHFASSMPELQAVASLHCLDCCKNFNRFSLLLKQSRAEEFPLICIPYHQPAEPLTDHCPLQVVTVPYSLFPIHCSLSTADGHAALKCGMHAQWVRAACTLPALRAPLLPLLVSFLGAHSWSDARQASWLASIIPDLIDAVQSTEGSTGLALCKRE